MNTSPKARLNKNNPIHKKIIESLSLMDNNRIQEINGISKTQNILHKSPNLEQNLPIIKQFQNQNMMQMLEDFKTPESNKTKSKSKKKPFMQVNKKCTTRKCHKKNSIKKKIKKKHWK
jgi:hypothetical protein